MAGAVPSLFIFLEFKWPIQQGEQDQFEDLALMNKLSIRWLKETGKYLCLV
jgi:hypothetical protein